MLLHGLQGITCWRPWSLWSLYNLGLLSFLSHERVKNYKISCEKSCLTVALDWVPASGSGPVELTDLSRGGFSCASS